jgi:phage tail protein X
MTPSQLSKTQKTVQVVVEANHNLVEEAKAIAVGVPNYDGVVYKLLRLGLIITARLDSLYEANQQLVNQGQLLAVNNTLADLFKRHVEGE